MLIFNMFIFFLYIFELFKVMINFFYWFLFKKNFLKNDVFRLFVVNKNYDSVLYFFFEKCDDGI